MCECTVRLPASNAIAAVLRLVSRLSRVDDLAGLGRMSKKENLAIARAPVSALAIRYNIWS